MNAIVQAPVLVNPDVLLKDQERWKERKRRRLRELGRVLCYSCLVGDHWKCEKNCPCVCSELR